MAAFYQKSNHVLFHMESSEDWQKFDIECSGYFNWSHLQKLTLYLKDDVKTIVLEKNYFDADYRNTYYNFFARKFADYPSRTMRAHFFDKKIPPQRLFELDRYQDNYIGFCVIRPNRVASIGRTILNPYKLKNIHGYICLAKYPVHILGAELSAEGFPYISQDTDVTICAHAACWMIFRYFSQRYTRYAEIWPYEVAELTQDVSTGRLVPSKGLTVSQVTEMFSNFGFYPEIYMRKDYGDLFESLLYTYIESGLPVVAGLGKHSHAVTIIGHISKLSQGKPGLSSEQYLKGLIINDDNCMPYQTIRKKGVRHRKDGYWSKYCISDIDTFIVPLYEKIHVSAEHALKLSDALLEHHDFGILARTRKLNVKGIVTRTFLTSSKSYKKYRRENVLPFNISKVYCEMDMPKFVWVREISTPTLYAQGQIIGELILDATANKEDRFAFLSIHYPNTLILNNRNILTDDPKRFTKRAEDTTSLNPYKCYINNLCEV